MTTTPIDLQGQDVNDIAWLSALLHLTDSAYPIGGFAHSGGLEGMVEVENFIGEEQLRQFLKHEIADSLGTLELPLLHHAWMAGKRRDDGMLPLIDEVNEACRFSAEQRQASRRLGAQRWTLFEKLKAPQLSEEDRAFLSRLNTLLPHKHLSTVAGVEAALLGIPLAAAMTAYCHQTVMMVAQAAMKIMRIGQSSVQGLVSEMATLYPSFIIIAVTLELDDVGTSLPIYDIATAWHEIAPARMFLS